MVADEQIDAAIEQRIERLGWAEINAFHNALRRGQDVYEDAGGFMLRAIKALFGIRRDPVLAYKAALAALTNQETGR